MNIQELQDAGFKFVVRNEERQMEVWAKFTETKDFIQYYYVSIAQGGTISDLMTVNFGVLQMFVAMTTSLIGDLYMENKIEEISDKMEIWNNNKSVNV